MRLLITGGCGFIGANFIHQQMRLMYLGNGNKLLNIDALTYAADKKNVEQFDADSRHIYQFEKVDIRNAALLNVVIRDFQPTHVVHFAAESHVDRSLADGANVFVQTNVEGTYNLLEACRTNAHTLKRFVHVSTDEVFGSISMGSTDELSRFNPRNPYAASKAGAEHIVGAFVESFGFPAIITRCTNNYGRFQHTEKFVPASITRLLQGLPIHIFGDGSQVREWIHVEDHCRAIDTVLRSDKAVRLSYHVTGGFEISNYELARFLCHRLDVDPDEMIKHVADRPGHDQRYSLSSRYIHELGYEAKVPFTTGLDLTVEHYKNKVLEA